MAYHMYMATRRTQPRPRPNGPAPALIQVVNESDGLEEYSSRRTKPQQLADRAEEIGSAIVLFRSSIEEHIAAAAEPRIESVWTLAGLELAVSLDVEAEAGVIFARAKSAAGLELTLKWERK